MANGKPDKGQDRGEETGTEAIPSGDALPLPDQATEDHPDKGKSCLNVGNTVY